MGMCGLVTAVILERKVIRIDLVTIQSRRYYGAYLQHHQVSRNGNDSQIFVRSLTGRSASVYGCVVEIVISFNDIL